MADLRTGGLRERVEIYENTPSDDGFGGSIGTSSPYWTTRAKVEPLRGSKLLVANQEQLRAGYLITVRYRKDRDVNKALLLKYRGKWLSLTFVESDDIYKEYVTFIAMYSDTRGGAVSG